MRPISLQEATDLLVEHTQVINDVERITLWDAPRRVLAEDITATMDQPPFDRSPLDGYAVRSEDIKEASHEHPVRLKVIDEVMAGYMCHKTVHEGEAVRIMTGAPIPEGADCIIGQEDTDYGEDTVEIYEVIGHYQNYCFQGEDYKAGKVLLPKGTVLGPVDIGVISGTGRTEVLVYRRARAAILTSGDEVRLPGEALAEGKIYDNNLHTIGAQLMMWGIEVVYRERINDIPQLMVNRICEIEPAVDIIITSGGVSVGKKDIMHDTLKLLGAEQIFWKLAIKPGMPTLTAQYKGKLLICLSGNPYGAAVNIELLGRPIFAKMLHREDLDIERRPAVMTNSYPKKSGVTRYIRAYYKEGKVTIADGSNDSGILSNMCGCNCLIEVPAKTPRVDAGQQVQVVML